MMVLIAMNERMGGVAELSKKFFFSSRKIK